MSGFMNRLYGRLLQPASPRETPAVQMGMPDGPWKEAAHAAQQAARAGDYEVAQGCYQEALMKLPLYGKCVCGIAHP